ncbi:FCD domain-containing protein [Trinickia sp. EG282A]|uniref:GntR family transcriptional regulator n=1 Tax=Trinickia sp. EG282A TaxID=3237013 RepID=UPI0034D37161
MAQSHADFSVAPPNLAVVNGDLLHAHVPDMGTFVDAPALTPLQTRVTREILALARREDLGIGNRLAESLLAEKIGTSRTPVNVALHYLAALGVVYYDANRGFFMAKRARDVSEIAEQFFKEPDDPLYLKIADDRLAHQLSDVVSEADLMRHYDVSRSELRRVLSRMQEEGWIERQVGHGWQFMPMIDSVEAYEESYLFRAAVEPTGIMSPTFNANPAELEALRRRQQFIAGSGYLSMNSVELFEANSEFHETIAKWSGNRFIAQSVRRMDRLRRLVEYRQARARKPRQEQAIEHLTILDAIAAHDLLRAATLLRQHIEGARRAKVHAQEVFTPRP